jgi:hypothetical protein
MVTLTLRRRRSKKEQALSALSEAASATMAFLKAAMAWLMGQKATKVAAPAVAVGTAAVVVKKRNASHQEQPPGPVDAATPAAPAGVG